VRQRRPDLAPFVALIVALVFLATACHAPVTIVTPQGKVAYTANEVLKRVQELQNTVIAVGDIPNSGIPASAIRVIVAFTVRAAKVLDAAPAGSGSTVAVAWADAKRQIPLRYLADPRLQASVLAVDMMLAIFLPPGA